MEISNRNKLFYNGTINKSKETSKEKTNVSFGNNYADSISASENIGKAKIILDGLSEDIAIP